MSRIILIPGLLCDATVWQPALSRLGADACVADLLTQDSLTKMAQDCLDAYPGQLRVVGHSMGARVAMEIARLAPDRVERLALLDTGIHPLRAGEVAKREEVVRYAYNNGMQALANRWLPGMVYAPNRDDSAMMQALNEMVLSKTPDLHARQIKALVDRPDASAYLADITCPVLLVVGREDQWSPVAQHEEMRGLLADARLEIIKNAGHFSPLEQPDTVSKILVEFLG